MILGDFNGYIGKDEDGFKSVHRRFGLGHRNVNGERALEFLDSFGL